MTALLASLEPLIAVLRSDGYTVIGPTLRDGAIVLTEIGESRRSLPYGTASTWPRARTAFRARGDAAAFGHAAGPQSWKSFLHPPARRCGRPGDRGVAATFTYRRRTPEPVRYAFLGVRPCDLRAIAIQDRVLGARRRLRRSAPRRRS